MTILIQCADQVCIVDNLWDAMGMETFGRAAITALKAASINKIIIIVSSIDDVMIVLTVTVI